MCELRLLLVVILAGAGSVALAQYRAKPVRLVVPFTPGGSSDVVARLVTHKLVDFWGQQFVIDNRPGAGGAVGAETVARAAPDGYTIMMPAVRSRLEQLGVEIEGGTPEKFGAFIRSEAERIAPLVRTGALQIE